MPPSSEQLARAAEALNIGQRSLARDILLDVVETDARNAQAWRMLSIAEEDVQNKILALQNALALFPPTDPEHFVIPGQIDALNVQLVEQICCQKEREAAFQQALRLVAAGKYVEAGDILKDIVQADPGNQAAWMLLSETCPEPEMKYWALKKVLEINPDNAKARERLEQLRPVQKNPLQRGEYLEIQGRDDAATKLYQSVAVHSRSAADRLEAARRIEAIRQRQFINDIQKVNPTLELLRLTAGPVILFATMAFLQSGLNVLHLSLLSLLGSTSVLMGSMLISAAEMRPAHPMWIRLFGTPGKGDEPEMRKGLKLLGWALLLVPFTIFLLDAAYRLGVLQASVLSH